MGKRCFAQSTWIDYEDITFEKKKREKTCYVENLKGRPRQKLRQNNPARFENSKGRSRQKIRAKTMGTEKIT